MDGGRRTAGGGRQCGRYGVLTNFVRARALPGYDLGQCFGPAGGHRARGHFGEDAGVRVARKHLSWYSRGLFGSTEFRATVNKLSSRAAVEALIDAFFDPLIDRNAARAPEALAA